MSSTAGPRATSRTRSVAWGLSYTSVQTALQFVQGLVLVPLYLKKIDIALYGAWLASGNVLALLSLADPGIGDIMRVRLSRALGARELDSAAAIVGTGLSLMAGVVALFSIAALVLAPIVPAIIHLDAKFVSVLRNALILGAIGTGLILFSYPLSNVLEACQRQFEVGVASLVSSIASLGTLAFLLLRSNLGVYALAIAPIVRGGVAIALYSPLIWISLKSEGLPRLHWSRVEAAEFRSIGILTFLARAFSTLIQQSDALLTSIFLVPSQTVVLSLTARPKDLLQAFPSRLNHAAEPAMAHRIGADEVDGNPRAREKTVALSRSLIALSIAFAGTLLASYVYLNHEFMVAWVGQKIFGGNALTLLLAGSSLCLVARDAVGYQLSSFNGLKTNALLAITEGTIRVLVAVSLIRWLNILALPIAGAVASSAVLPLSTYALSKRQGVRFMSSLASIGRSLAAGAASIGVAYAITWLGWTPHGKLQLVLAGAIATPFFGILALWASPRARGALFHALTGLFPRIAARIARRELNHGPL